MNPWIAVGMLALVGIFIPVLMIGISWLLRPSVPEQGKRSTYESGEVPTGNTRIRFNIQYYMVALLFVVFDIETVMIFPWTVIYQDAVRIDGLTWALGPMLLFILILIIPLAWAWRKGAVQWVRRPRYERRMSRHE
ncbi:MAG: NADH-quinone oxidoreductase subunit A [Halodesulfurarchaeum sp.]